MTCSDCSLSAKGHPGIDCPMLKIGIAKTFAGGCNLIQVRGEAKRAEERRIEALPDVKMYPASDVKIEKDLQKLCEQELCRNEIEFLHLSPMAREKQGWPDLTFVINGQPYAVELKGPTGKLSDAQRAVLGRMKANGWDVAVCRTFDCFKRIISGGRIGDEGALR